MVYCEASDVRIIANIPVATMSDAALNALIVYATGLVNKEINGIVKEELVQFIDDVRENKIDGSNTVYYVRASWCWFLGDYDNDGDVDTSDVVVYEYDSDDNKTELSVSSVDEEGKITLSTAPESTSKVTITYAYAPVSEYTPDPLLKLATMQLSAAMAFSKIHARDWSKLSLGKLSVSRGRFDRPYYEYKAQFDETMNLLKSRLQKRITNDVSGMKDVINQRLK